MEVGLDLDGRRAFHASVVVGGEEDDQVGNVYDVGTIVLVHVAEGQVDQVEQQEGHAQADHQEGAQLIGVVVGDVDADGHPVEDDQGDVELGNRVGLEGRLELAIPLVATELESDDPCEGQDQGDVERSRAQGVEVVLRRGVPPVDAGRKGDVEAVEEEEGDRDFLEDENGGLLELLGLEQERQHQAGDPDAEEAHEHQVHDVEVVDEGRRNRQVGNGLGGLALLLVVADVEPVEHAELGEGGQVHIHEIIVGQVEESQLQDSEQLQPYYLLAQQGDQHHSTARVDHGRNQLFCLLGPSALFL